MKNDYIDVDYTELKQENKKYFTIDEVAKILKVDDSDIIFWFNKFKDILNIPTVGMFQVFEKNDITNLQKIKELLVDKNMSIDDVRKHFKENTTSLIIRERSQEELNVFNYFNKIMSSQHKQMQEIIDTNNQILETNQKLIKLLVHSYSELSSKQDLSIELQSQIKDVLHETKDDIKISSENTKESFDKLNNKLDIQNDELLKYNNRINESEKEITDKFSQMSNDIIKHMNEQRLKDEEEKKKHKGFFSNWFKKE